MNAVEIDNNFTYHAPKLDQPERYESIRRVLRDAAHFINATCPNSREKSLAMTHLETAMMWANASIARNE